MHPDELFSVIVTWPDGSWLVAGEHLTIAEAVYLRKRLVCWGIDEEVLVEPEWLEAIEPSCASRLLEQCRRALARFRPSFLPR